MIANGWASKNPIGAAISNVTGTPPFSVSGACSTGPIDRVQSLLRAAKTVLHLHQCRASRKVSSRCDCRARRCDASRCWARKRWRSGSRRPCLHRLPTANTSLRRARIELATHAPIEDARGSNKRRVEHDFGVVLRGRHAAADTRAEHCRCLAATRCARGQHKRVLGKLGTNSLKQRDKRVQPVGSHLPQAQMVRLRSLAPCHVASWHRQAETRQSEQSTRWTAISTQSRDTGSAHPSLM